MDTKTWIAVTLGAAALGLPPAYAADRDAADEAQASERRGVETSKPQRDDAQARRDAQRQERERADADTETPSRPINPNAI